MYERFVVYNPETSKYFCPSNNGSLQYSEVDFVAELHRAAQYSQRRNAVERIMHLIEQFPQVVLQRIAFEPKVLNEVPCEQVVLKEYNMIRRRVDAIMDMKSSDIEQLSPSMWKAHVKRKSWLRDYEDAYVAAKNIK